jgi:hypothetical protein
MRRLVDRALNPPPPSNGNGDSNGSESPASSTSAAPSDPAETPSPQPTEEAVDDVQDACAYDAKQAAEALAEGEPPSKFGPGG